MAGKLNERTATHDFAVISFEWTARYNNFIADIYSVALGHNDALLYVPDYCAHPVFLRKGP